ncbi:MAG: hypothetical protein ABS76_30010 [Pelagibacterium sp. SCN 64-44]|nr:MAG: hypothetical protein ABS76_30010 [Pelagibacterium sp. SCN 64-44]
MIRKTHPAFLALLPLLLLASPALSHDAQAPAADGAAAHSAPDSAEIRLGDIVISGAFTRATLPNAPVAGGFLTLTNAGAEDDVLVSASAEIAAETQIHEMAMQGDVMKMRQLADGLAVPAGESVVLAPGGFHIMFMGLKAPLMEGDSVPVTLTFAKAGSVTISLAVGANAANAPAESHAAPMSH